MKQMEKKLAVVSTSQLVVLAVYKLQNGRWQLDIYIRPKSHRETETKSLERQATRPPSSSYIVMIIAEVTAGLEINMYPRDRIVVNMSPNRRPSHTQQTQETEAKGQLFD